jgi:hypothetical protein
MAKEKCQSASERGGDFMKNGVRVATCWRESPDVGAVTQPVALTPSQREGKEENRRNARRAFIIMINVLIET